MMANQPFVTSSTAMHSAWWSDSARVLHEVERLPQGATGALRFGDEGVVLVENKRVCWAVARDMKQRLTDLLCEQRAPNLPRTTIEELYRRCKRENRPLGETLVESELVSYAEVRSALERHNCEALRRLARSAAIGEARFSPLASRGYDPRLIFSVAQLFAALSQRRYPEHSVAAAALVSSCVQADVQAFAFIRDPKLAQPVVIAVQPSCALPIEQITALGAWATRALDVASFVDPSAQLVRATFCERIQLLAFRRDDIHYAALCTSRVAATLLIDQLQRRAFAGDTGNVPNPKEAS